MPGRIMGRLFGSRETNSIALSRLGGRYVLKKRRLGKLETRRLQRAARKREADKVALNRILARNPEASAYQIMEICRACGVRCSEETARDLRPPYHPKWGRELCKCPECKGVYETVIDLLFLPPRLGNGLYLVFCRACLKMSYPIVHKFSGVYGED